MAGALGTGARLKLRGKAEGTGGMIKPCNFTFLSVQELRRCCYFFCWRGSKDVCFALNVMGPLCDIIGYQISCVIFLKSSGSFFILYKD